MNVNTEIYLDNSATTQVLPEIAARMAEVMTRQFGNPSSLHSRGLEAENLIRAARKNISQALQVKEQEIFFTSGGTESNNLALIGAALQQRRKRKHIICSAIEHPSVLETVKHLGQNGFAVDFCPVNKAGLIDGDYLAGLVNDDTLLVSIMLVNNEIGTIQPIKDLVQRCKALNPQLIFHSDGVQAVGKIPVYPQEMGVDLLSVSAHKFHGPKGVGGLYIKTGTSIKSLLQGGGQENGLRPGTENVPGIVGFGLALQRAREGQEENMIRMKLLKEKLLASLDDRSVAYKVNGPEPGTAAPHILNLSFPNTRGEILVRCLEAEGIYVSTGSACTSRKTRTSHVLKALGMSDRQAAGAIRISLSALNTDRDMECLAAALQKALQRF